MWKTERKKTIKQIYWAKNRLCLFMQDITWSYLKKNIQQRKHWIFVQTHKKTELMLLLIKFHPLHKPRRYTINIVSRRSLWLLMLLWIHFGYKKYLHIWFVWILQLHFASCLPAHQVCRAAGADTMGTSLCNYVQCSQQKENWILRPQLKTLQDILMLLIFCNFALQNVQFERQ